MSYEDVVGRIDAGFVVHASRHTMVAGEWGTTWCGAEWRWERHPDKGADRRTSTGAVVTSVGEARRSPTRCPTCFEQLAVLEGVKPPLDVDPPHG